MAKDTDLIGLGMAPALGQLEGYTIATITTAGTSAGTATDAGTASLISLNTAGSQTGLILNANTPLGKPIVIGCPTATTGVVYPPTGATINAASSISVAQNKTLLVIRFSATVFFSVLTA